MFFDNLEQIRTFLGYDQFSNSMDTVFSSFQSQSNHLFMDIEELTSTIHLLKLDLIDFTPLLNVLNEILKQPKLIEALSFIKYAMIIGAHPSAWLIKHGPKMNLPICSDHHLELLIVLSLIQPSLHDHQKRQIDPKYADFNLGHLRNYIRNYYDKHHELGIEPFGWTSYLASLGLINIESLNFMHHVFTDPYVCLVNQHTSETLILVNQMKAVNCLGQFSGVNQVNDVKFHTEYEENDQFIYGNPVNSRGIITPNPVKLDRKDWKLMVKQGDSVIDFHIPTGVPYDLESFRSTLCSGKKFFENHFPEFNYRAFWCVSWLYSPQLPLIITKPSSHIMAIHEQGYICPATPGESSLFSFVFKTEKPDFKHIVPKTSLEQNVISFVNKGGKVNAGLFLYLIKDLHRFGQKPYLKPNEIKEYYRIQPYKEDKNA